MVSIGNLTARQAAVSSGRGIGFMVRKIGSMVSKVYNGLRTWGSGNSRSSMQQLSRPSVNKQIENRASRTRTGSQGKITKTGSQAGTNDEKMIRKPGSTTIPKSVRTRQILKEIRSSVLPNNRTKTSKPYNSTKSLEFFGNH